MIDVTECLNKIYFNQIDCRFYCQVKYIFDITNGRELLCNSGQYSELFEGILRFLKSQNAKKSQIA